MTAAPSSFAGLPAGTKAVQIPDTGVNSYFLTVFGKPEAASACECERSQEANLAQSLHLLNSSEVQGKLSNGTGRAARLAADASRSDEDKVRELYLCVYAREPASDELAIATGHIDQEREQATGLRGHPVGTVNTKEFLFNH